MSDGVSEMGGERFIMRCDFEPVREHAPDGTILENSFTAAVIRVMFEESFESVGDFLSGDPNHYVKTVSESADAVYPIQAYRKQQIAQEAIDCVKQRYSGDCNPGTCSSWQEVTRAIGSVASGLDTKVTY